jgi:hypothetical protein
MRQFVTGMWHTSAAGAIILLLLMPSGAQQGEFPLALAILSLYLSGHSIDILKAYYYLPPSKLEVNLNYV